MFLIMNDLFIDCDKACNGCNGDGPDMCIQCAEGHHKKDNICISTSEAAKSEL